MTSPKSTKDPTKNRLTSLLTICLLFVAAILTKAAYIQLIGNDRLEKLARRQFQSKMLIRPRRGVITDRNGEPLAINVETRSLAVSPNKIQNKRTMARLISKATELPYQRILEKLIEKREFAWIKRHVSDSEFERYKKWQITTKNGEAADGILIVKESKRIYPHHELAAHILGSVNVDSEGVEGIELLNNEKLQGKIVSIQAEKDAFGRPTFIDATAANHVRDGEQVTLTIDASLQFSVEQELRNAVLRTNARAGSVIVMNAVTGEILALANTPSFDPNLRHASASRRRNRVITDGYEPGSTQKTLLLAAGLQHGFKLSDKVWGEKGSFIIQGKRISEAESHEKFEWLTLKKVLQVSSNIGAAKLAIKLGTDRYYSVLKTFGFGAKTSIDFPGEISGYLPPKKKWKPLSLANIGFGQGILVTPLQMARAYAAIANGGWLVRPKLVMDSESKTNEQPKRILTPKTRQLLVEALLSVTEEGGTGLKAKVEGYKIAGKTATAQVIDPKSKKYSRSRYIASFIGFPVGVEPNIVIFTALDQPKGVYYASETAAPLFKAVLTAAANRFSMPATMAVDRKLAEKDDSSVISDKLKWSLAKVTTSEQNRALNWVGKDKNGSITWQMPPLVGLSVREAIKKMQGHMFDIEISGIGFVKTQEPESGKPIAEGDIVRLTLSEE